MWQTINNIPSVELNNLKICSKCLRKFIEFAVFMEQCIASLASYHKSDNFKPKASVELDDKPIETVLTDPSHFVTVKSTTSSSPTPQVTKRMGRIPNNQIFTCDSCTVRFRDKKLLLLHVKEKHLLMRRCPTCNLIVASGDEFERHMAQHNESTSSICTSCGKSFKMRIALTIHMRDVW